jgi:hypothetical protein
MRVSFVSVTGHLEKFEIDRQKDGRESGERNKRQLQSYIHPHCEDFIIFIKIDFIHLVLSATCDVQNPINQSCDSLNNLNLSHTLVKLILILIHI